MGPHLLDDFDEGAELVAPQHQRLLGRLGDGAAVAAAAAGARRQRHGGGDGGQRAQPQGQRHLAGQRGREAMGQCL